MSNRDIESRLYYNVEVAIGDWIKITKSEVSGGAVVQGKVQSVWSPNELYIANNIPVTIYDGDKIEHISPPIPDGAVVLVTDKGGDVGPAFHSGGRLYGSMCPDGTLDPAYEFDITLDDVVEVKLLKEA